MGLVVIDTDVASSMLRRRTPEPLVRRLVGQVLAVTFVTVGELTKWRVLRSWGPARTASMNDLLDQFVVLPYDDQVARIWGQLQANAQLRGRPRPVNDTWIAACCLARNVPLATFNTKDFSDFSDHEGLVMLS